MDIQVSEAEVSAVLAARMPWYRIDSVRELGAGQDNVSYEVNGELVLRFGRDADRRADLVSAEARLLATVAAIAPVPVPEPLFVAVEFGCLAYHKLPGVPLIDLPADLRSDHARHVAAMLGEVLAALHTLPHARVADLVEVDDYSMDAWVADAVRDYATVADHLPAEHRPAVECFLAAPPPEGHDAAVFSHNDLGIEHVLVDPHTGRVSGVIDWTDAALTDPAYDFGLLHRDLGPAALDRALDSYRAHLPVDPGLRDRAHFYARCGALADLVYGLDHRKYFDKSTPALTWLFPRGVPVSPVESGVSPDHEQRPPTP